jgi:hypothetical protein
MLSIVMGLKQSIPMIAKHRSDKISCVSQFFFHLQIQTSKVDHGKRLIKEKD